jgi:hypothetical protein
MCLIVSSVQRDILVPLPLSWGVILIAVFGGYRLLTAELSTQQPDTTNTRTVALFGPIVYLLLSQAPTWSYEHASIYPATLFYARDSDAMKLTGYMS